MFIGHFAVGFASKRVAPRTSLALLIAAALLADILWPIFLLLGWEHVRIDPAAMASELSGPTQSLTVVRCSSHSAILKSNNQGNAAPHPIRC